MLLSADGVSYDGSADIEVSVGTVFSIGLDHAPDVTLSSSNISNPSGTEVLVYDGENQKLIVNRAGTATFTISQPGTTTIAEKTVVFTIVASKRVPQWECTLPANLYERNGYDCPIHLTDAPAEQTLTSDQPGIFPSLSQTEYGEDPTVLLGALTGAAQSFNLTFHQDGNHQYESVTQTIPVTVKAQITRLPIDGLNTDLAQALVYSVSGFQQADAVSSDGKKLVLNGTDKNQTYQLVIHFEGIPDELSCTIYGDVNNGIFTKTRWQIEESANGSSGWTDVFPSQIVTDKPKDIPPMSLKPTTRYIRFTYSGASGLAGEIRNLKITELLFSSDPSFLIYHIGDVTPQQVKITCASINAVSHGFSAGTDDKFNITTVNLHPVAFDDYIKGTADINILSSVTEPFDAQWAIDLTQYGGGHKDATVD